MSTAPKTGDLRVYWIPQVPMKSFYVYVDSPAQAAKILDVLSDYDLFQFHNNVKPDYTNAGGLAMFDSTDTEDGPDGSWLDWYDEETGDDIREWAESRKNIG